MPSYDYKCEKCSTVVEITRAFDEESSPSCTSCQSYMSRVWTSTPAHFKGGGWGGK